MTPASSPPDETARLAALHAYRVLDTLPEQALDDLAALAAQICEAPMALISLVDADREWFKSRIGLDVGETSRAGSSFAHSLPHTGLFVVPDAAADSRFADNTLVRGHAVRFYAGTPLVTVDGHVLGALAVLDRVPRQLTAAQEGALGALGRQVMSQLELRRQARELIASERRLRTMFENEPECVKLLGPACELLEMNPAGLRMIEADSMTQVAGRSVLDLVLPEHRAAFAALTGRVMNGESGTLEFEIQGIKGTRRWLETHAAPLRSEQGEITALLGITREITAYKQAEEAARESADRLRMAIDAAHMGTFDWDVPGNHSTWSRCHEELWGFAPGEFDGTYEAFASRVHPEDLPALSAAVSRAITGRTAYAHEFRVRWPDGSVRWMAGRGEFTFDEAGEPLRMRGAIVEITAIREAAARLRDKSAQLETALDMSRMGVWSWDLQTDTLRTIEGSGPVSGLPEPLYPKTGAALLALVHPEDRAVVAGRIERARSTGEYTVEFRIVLPGGDVRWVAERGRCVRDAAGRAVHLTGVDQDITERKEAERRTQHSNRVYAVLSNINETIVRERDSQALLESACRIAVEKGWFRMAWIGLVEEPSGPLRIAAYAGAAEDTLAMIRGLLGDGTSDEGCVWTYQAVRTGEHGVCNDIARDPGAAPWRDAAIRREYRAMAALPLTSGSRVIGTFNLYAGESGFFDEEELRLLDELAADISFALEVHEREAARHRVEQALRESEERFRQLAENVQEVFWITDPSAQRLLYVSPAYEKIWGRCSDSLHASLETWLATIHPDDRARTSQAKMTRGDYDETYRILRPDGSVRWIHDRAFPIRGPGGEVLRVVGTAADITDRRLLEEQLRQSQKMEAIGQLAGGVAHDFNNILAAIMMQADLAAAEPGLPEGSRELFDDIRANTERAANLTRQLLAFSRRQVMQPRQLDLNEVVTSLTKMLQRIVGEDVGLQLNLHPRPLLTRGDPGMLDQVLLNLVVNARDAMPGGGRLFIATAERLLSAHDAAAMPDVSAGRHVCLRVSDTGGGIDPQHLPRIFEPFFTTKEAGKGTGLGLATVFGIVKQHRGWVTVESTVGSGATFEVLLPIDEDAARARTEAAAAPALRRRTETILLVEDEPGVRMLTRVVLERQGYRVLEAAHGLEAVRLWDQHQATIRLLLTDIVMPEGVNGRELAARFRAANPTLPVIFTSGYSAEIAGRQLSLLEGQNFLQKPFSPRQLLEIVDRSLSR